MSMCRHVSLLVSVLFGGAVLLGACGGTTPAPVNPSAVDTRSPDRRAIDEVLRVLAEGEGPTAYDLARGFLEQFPESTYVVTAHGVIAVVSLESDSPETARQPLEEVTRLATDPLVLATAHLQLAELLQGSSPSDALDHALLARAAIARGPAVTDEWNATLVALVSSALVASERPALASAEGVLALLETSAFDEATRNAIAHRAAEVAFLAARWSLALELERALGLPRDATPASCDVLARAARASGYGGGPLEANELVAARACGIVVGTPVRIASFDLTAWVDALHSSIDGCVAADRAHRRGAVVELVLEASQPKPHFASTGRARLDRCLAHAIETSAVIESRIQRPDAYPILSAAPLLSIPLTDDP